VDPFLLWKSPSLQENSLYATLSNSFNHLGYLANTGQLATASQLLITASECDEVGLGFSGHRKGLRIGEDTAREVLSLFQQIPQLAKHGFVHYEEVQLYVDHVATDRISDVACSFLKSFLIDYTIDQCSRLGIPTAHVSVRNVYDVRRRSFGDEQAVLPVNPVDQRPILLVPKRWLRKNTWIGYDDYVATYYSQAILNTPGAHPDRPQVLNFNRHNYDAVQRYVAGKERQQADCRNDPLFLQLPVASTTRKLSELKKLPTGTSQRADKRYEELAAQLVATLLYPQLDFAAEQSRTDSGVLIRDLIFYNNRGVDFLRDIYDDYTSRQIVFELKNVAAISREHINQLNRYLTDQFGRFGVLLTRNPPSGPMFRNTVDLWAGQRRCILIMTDADLELMVRVYESKQRLPVEVLKAKYVDFVRRCPS
jgi:hypothetical protein